MTVEGEFTFEGARVPFRAGDRLLTALVRAGHHPSGGGALCLEGHSPHCLAEVDGVTYVHTCQTPARVGSAVRSQHPDPPPLPRTGSRRSVPVRNLHPSTVVIGGGVSGRAAVAAADDAIVLEAIEGREAVGIFPGPMVAARTPEGMVHVHADRVVVGRRGAVPHGVLTEEQRRSSEGACR